LNEGTLFLATLGAIAWFWHTGRTAHERVLEIGRVVCRDLDVQLLDDTVALHRFALRWRRHGIVARRIYGFEFSADGSARSSGEIALEGLKLDWVQIEHPDGSYFIDIPGR